MSWIDDEIWTRTVKLETVPPPPPIPWELIALGLGGIALIAVLVRK